MQSPTQLPQPLHELVIGGQLRRITDTEFAIDPLRHRVMTGWGWQTIVFCLRIGELEDCDFEIVEESEYSGGECCLASDDPEEIADWISDRIEEREE